MNESANELQSTIPKINNLIAEIIAKYLPNERGLYDVMTAIDAIKKAFVHELDMTGILENKDVLQAILDAGFIFNRKVIAERKDGESMQQFQDRVSSGKGETNVYRIRNQS
jgi:ABC-type uncharacterized transport system ATPase subunit